MMSVEGSNLRPGEGCEEVPPPATTGEYERWAMGSLSNRVYPQGSKLIDFLGKKAFILRYCPHPKCGHQAKMFVGYVCHPIPIPKQPIMETTTMSSDNATAFYGIQSRTRWKM